MRINKHDTNGTKPLLGKGELGYDDYTAGGDTGRVFVGTGTENIAQAKKAEVVAVDGKVNTHIARSDNPHSVTKAQVGLDSVDNTSDVTKNVLSATKWTTPRTITLSGDVTGSVSIDGSANATITTTVAANSIALGTDTTGNYVAGNTAGTGITVTGTAGEGWSPTISIDSTVATLTGAQTLTNKTLQDSTTFIVDNTDATKKVQFDVAGVTTATTRTLTIPNVNGTIVTTGDTGTVTSAMIADGTIVNADINASAGIVDTKLATISTAGKVLNSATTATNLNTAGTIVARDASGDFAAGIITASLNGNASTSTTLQTPKTISMSGAITGTATSFDGSANITIPTTVSTTQGGIVYGSSATAYGTTAAGTSGYILSSNGSSAPTWVENTLLAFPGSTFKKSARVATTAALTLNTATATIDGVTLTATDRVLIKNQATASQNGIYTGVTTTTWTRTTDSDSSSDIASAVVAIDEGTANGGRLFTNTFKATDTLGTTAMAWYEVVYDSGTWTISTTGSAATLTTGRTIGMTGDVAWTSASFNGSANVTGVATLANTGVVAGTYKSVTTDAKGRITGGTNPTTISGFGITDAYTKTETAASISTAISNLVATAPATLDTLNELAAALGNDPSFATTVTNNIATKVTKNADIVAGTGTKITYDAKGLVTGSTTLSTTDIPSLDAGKITTGVLPVSVGGTGVATLTGIVKGNGTGAMTAAIAGTDYVIPSGSISGNAGTATALQTTRTFSATGDVTATAQNFNGSANVVLPLVLANSGVTAGSYAKVTVDAKGRVTAGLVPTMEDIPDAVFKKSARVATTANLVATYASNVLTMSAVGVTTIDGITIALNDRILIKDQTTQIQNGIYIVSTLGTASVATVFTRALDADTSSELAGSIINVDTGTVNGGLAFTNNFKTNDIIGTNAVIFYKLVFENGTWNIAITGNAGTATALATGRTIGMTGDVTWTSASFNGSGNVTGTSTLATITDSGTGTFKKITTNTKGLVTGTQAVSQTDITGLLGTGSITNAMIANTAVSNLSGTNTGDQTITLTGDITGSGTGSFAATLSNSGVTAGTYSKVTVDSKGRVTAGLTPMMDDIPDAAFKRSVKCATIGDITLSGLQTIDGITVVDGDRVLVKNQSVLAENGIYLASTSTWTRALDADTNSKIGCAIVAVDGGTVNGADAWTTTFKATDILGTTDMNWYELLYNSGTWAINTSGTAAKATNIVGGAIGTIPYQSATDTTAHLAAGTAGFVFKSGGAAAPVWEPFTYFTSGVGTSGITGATNYPLYPAANDTITLDVGTYWYEVSTYCTVATSTVSATFQFSPRGAGTAVGTATYQGDAAITANGAGTRMAVGSTALGTAMTVSPASAVAGRVYVVRGSGIINITTAGTLIPSYLFSATVTSGVVTLNAMNWMAIEKIAPSSVTYFGGFA